MWTEKIINFANSLFARGVVLIDPDTGDPYKATGGSSSGGTGSDRELVVSTYRCKTAFTGASVGDTITTTQIIDVTTNTPVSVSTIWRNQTTAADLASVPSAANLELTGSTALTAAQLTAAGLSTAALQIAGNLSLSNIDTDLGTQADAAATTDTGTFSVIAFIKRGMQNWTTFLSRIPAALTAGGNFKTAIAEALPAGTNAIGSIVGQRPFAAAVTITRPANTTAYAANAVLSTATTGLSAFPTFALPVGNNTRATINNVMIVSSNGAAATKGQFAVYLFNVANPTVPTNGYNDGQAFAPTVAALATTTNEIVGVVPSLIPMGTAAYGYGLINDTRQVVTDASGNVYLAVVLQNAYTPASAETITVIVSGVY